MGDSREPRDPAHRAIGPAGSLSVGGSTGIRVDSSGITVGGLFVADHAARPPPAAAPLAMSPSSPLATLEHGASLVTRHSAAVAGALLFGAAAIATTSAVVISLLEASWLLFLIPSIPALACLLCALALLSRGRQADAGHGGAEVERRLLTLAVERGGQLTVTAAAVGLGIPLAQAEAALAELVRGGHVTVENDAATGAVLYVFRDIHAGLGERPRRLL
jgi:hypothetical protein